MRGRLLACGQAELGGAVLGVRPEALTGVWVAGGRDGDPHRGGGGAVAGEPPG
jgi:hypothetical protein